MVRLFKKQNTNKYCYFFGQRQLVSNLTSSTINIFDIKISGKGIARAGKEFISIISNEDMNDIINIKKKTLKDSGVLIDGVTETAKHKKK